MLYMDLLQMHLALAGTRDMIDIVIIYTPHAAPDFNLLHLLGLQRQQ